MDWIVGWDVVLFLLNVFTVPDDDGIFNLCLALYAATDLYHSSVTV